MREFINMEIIDNEIKNAREKFYVKWFFFISLGFAHLHAIFFHSFHYSLI